MRSLKKGDKPQILIDKFQEWTNELMGYINRAEKIPKSLEGKYRHSKIKDAVIRETYNKCAYCESKLLHIDFGDIEHIEPKTVLREKTFLWENLTLGCAKCNSNKKAYYSKDNPLLNPYTDKPEKKIIFIGSILFPNKGNIQAIITIKQLKLNRPELIEKRTECINSIEPLLNYYHSTDNEDLKKLIWKDIESYYLPEKEYSLMMEQIIKEKFSPSA